MEKWKITKLLSFQNIRWYKRIRNVISKVILDFLFSEKQILISIGTTILKQLSFILFVIDYWTQLFVKLIRLDSHLLEESPWARS